VEFESRVLELCKKIPRGKITTYAELAKAAGKPRAARAVGAIMRANKNSEVPCHRVVASNGKLHGFNRGLKEKERLLRAEGVPIEKGRVLDLEKSLHIF